MRIPTYRVPCRGLDEHSSMDLAVNLVLALLGKIRIVGLQFDLRPPYQKPTFKLMSLLESARENLASLSRRFANDSSPGDLSSRIRMTQACESLGDYFLRHWSNKNQRIRMLSLLLVRVYDRPLVIVH